MSKYIKSLILISVCSIILVLPLTLLFAAGEAEHNLEGEMDFTRPGFSLAGFFSGDFQSDFENWFSTKYPLRPNIIDIYGRIEVRKDDFNFAFASAAVQPAFMSWDIHVEPGFPEYVLVYEELFEPEGYRGNAQVVIGKNGFLFENGYINEYLGFSPKYTEVTDEQLIDMVTTLKNIQTKLSEKGIAFLVVITPSKASSMPQFIPAWYIARHTAAPGYVRPYTRFLNLLVQQGVYHVDSASLYRAVGLTNTFPKTGTHWTKLAAFETVSAVLKNYETQSGKNIKKLAFDEILSSEEPPGFGNSEKDIFGIVYAGKRNELENAITDELYFWPDAYVINGGNPIPHVTMQGGSFIDDFVYYFTEYGIVSDITSIRYNNSGNVDSVWAEIINKTDFIIFEVNEQFIHNMGGNAPSFGQNDYLVRSAGSNIIDALKEYLNDF